MKKIFVFFLVMGVIASALVSCALTEPRPEIKEGKFRFSVTYEVDGREETVSSVLVCKFVDVVAAVDGAYREWDSYIEDGALAARLEQTRGYLLLKNTDDGEIYLDLNLTAQYFMADPDFDVSDEDVDSPDRIGPRLFIEYNSEKYEEIAESYSEDAAVLETYGVKLIGFEYDQPIKNSFN